VDAVSEINVNYLQQKYLVNWAADKYHVPYGILAGVYGMETNWGRNVATSSAGAIGPFQFTAADKGTGLLYPMTNSPTATQFGQQADAAAAYLAQLFKQHGGNWDAALHAYSGGGYGLSQVSAKAVDLQRGSGAYSGGGVSPAAAILGGALVGAGAVAGEAAGVAAGAGEAAAGTGAGEAAAGAGAGEAAAGAGAASGLGAAAQFASLTALADVLLNHDLWLRVLEVIGGVALLIMGLMSLSGRTTTPVTVAKGAARNASKAAVAL
jgi:hypothetical protein